MSSSTSIPGTSNTLANSASEGDQPKVFARGDRVRCKRYRVRGGRELGGWTGTIACLSGDAHGLPSHLLVIVVDDEKDEEGKALVRAVCPSLLEPLERSSPS
jgi:hypothetical protein